MANEKARNSKKILKALEAKEEQIIDIVFNEFMRCLKPKPRFFPVILFTAFFMSLVSPKFAWTWLTRRYVFNLARAENLNPERFEAVQMEVEQGLNNDDPPVKFTGHAVQETGEN